MVAAKNYIAGEWVTDARGPEVRAPGNLDEVLGTVPLTTPAEVEAAVEAAARAQDGWRHLSGVERGNILFRAAAVLEAHVDELGALAAREMGKPIGEARAEAARAVSIFRYYAGEGSRAIGEVIPSANATTLQFTLRVPLGVVGIITPWNFPLAIPAWKMAPALAYGNTVVLKPAEWASLTAARIIELIGPLFPPGVVNLILGKGSVVGEALVRHPAVAGISFTGSGDTGQHIAQVAVERGAKYQLEMGGKNPVIVADDADLERVVELTVSGAMRSAGQKCTATSRVIATRGIKPRLAEALVERVRQLKQGNPLDPDTYLGPVVSAAQEEKILAMIQKGREEGARILAGGGRADVGLKGFYIAPTVFDDVDSRMTIAQEEIFGPVVAIQEAADIEDAIRIANGVRYGLSASVFTRDLKTALLFVDRIEAGMVRVNEETAGVELQAPFGGMKASSSHSREQGRAAIEFFTHTKTVAIRP
jgi:acyl-CoA reductase-like NAD-dependent aldehyde dehydrogenase